MADSYTQATMNPFIPKEFVTAEEIEVLSRFGLQSENTKEGGALYFFADEYMATAYFVEAGLAKTVFPDLEIHPEAKEIELEEDRMLEILQRIIKRSNGEIRFITLEGAYTCSKMRPGELLIRHCF